MRGLIPAWAGKTCAWMSSRIRPKAHPRVGGENLGGSVDVIEPLGSSPRGRGKRETPAWRWCRCRLIPAWAGKTKGRSRLGSWDEAHPRVGGENWAGKERPTYPARLIPAWAGKTPSLTRSSQTARAHPRVGGENRV